jgi:hypothetical protein
MVVWEAPARDIIRGVLDGSTDIGIMAGPGCVKALIALLQDQH